jgi:prevent-host-death family protein
MYTLASRHMAKGGQAMQVGARDLRSKAARVLEEVQQGREVVITYRNKPLAVLKPLRPAPRRPKFEAIGFGLWAGRADLADVAGWVRQVRRPRYSR